MWNNVRYQPGELRVVIYDDNGAIKAEKAVRTAGRPHHLVATVNRNTLAPTGDDLAYITIQVADKDGNIVPIDNRRVKFSVSGAGTFEATANGDPTSLLPFQNPEMDLFSGAATAIVRSSNKKGNIIFTASAKGVKPVTAIIQVQ